MNFQQGPDGKWPTDIDWSNEVQSSQGDHEMNAAPYMNSSPTAPTGAAQGMPQSRVQGMPQTTPQDMMQSMPQSRVQGMPQTTPQDMMQSMPPNMPQSVPQGMPMNTQMTTAQRAMPQPLPPMAPSAMPNRAELETPSGGGLQMNHQLSDNMIQTPVSAQEVYQGSLKALLTRNLGHYVVATFLVGTQTPVSWEGFLHGVGNDYIVLFQPEHNRYITGDLYSLKFVEFSGTKGAVPANPGYRRRDGQKLW